MIIDINRDQLHAVSRLVENAGLPVQDLWEVDWFGLIGWYENKQTTGVAGLQQCGGSLLLRSVAVEQSCRGTGLAFNLVDTLHQRAKAVGHTRIFLLTLDATDYFKQKFEYCRIDRTQVPGDIAQTGQFLHICPDSAILMEKQLQ
jgi:amino-acid N-acetyltransferase